MILIKRLLLLVVMMLLFSVSKLSFANAPETLELFIPGIELTGESSDEAQESVIKEINPEVLKQLELSQLNALIVRYLNTEITFEQVDKFSNSTTTRNTSAEQVTTYRWMGLSEESNRLLLTVSDGFVSGNIAGRGLRVSLNPAENSNEVVLEIVSASD